MLDLLRRSEIARRAGETFAVRLVLAVIGVGTTVAVARALGPDGRGVYAVAAAIAGLGIQFGNLGVPISNTYFVARDRKLLPALFGNSVVLGLGVAGIACATVWAVMAFTPDWSPIDRGVAAVTLALIPFGLTFMLLQNLLLGLERTRAYNAVELATRLLSFVALVALLLWGVDTPAPFLAASLLGVVVGCVACARLISIRARARMAVSFSLVRRTAGYGAKAYVAAFFAFFLLRSDLIVVERLLGPTDAGYYSIAVSMADVLYLLPAAIGTILFPRLVTIADQRARWRTTSRIAYMVGAGLIVAAIGATVFAGPAIELVFGAEYRPAASSFVILCFAMLFYGVNNIISSFTAAEGLPLFSVYVWIVAAAANLVLNLALVPRYGLEGSAGASLLCYAFVLIAQTAYVKRRILTCT